MTCIVGIEHEGGVTIGADAAGSTNDITVARADVKLFEVGPYMFGFTHSFRMGQLLHHAFDPTLPDVANLDRFMVTTFIDELRSCFDDGGFSKHTNGVERGGTFLVAVAGRLFCIEGDYQVGSHLDGYAAAGSGELLAMGSLHTTAQFDFTPTVRARLALEAAARHNPFVGAPFLIKTQKV